MIKWFKNLAWMVQLRWIIFTARKRKRNYGWDAPPPPEHRTWE